LAQTTTASLEVMTGTVSYVLFQLTLKPPTDNWKTEKTTKARRTSLKVRVERGH